MTTYDERLIEALTFCRDALTPEQRAECELFAESGLDGELGMRVRLCPSDPSLMEAIWGGRLIGRFERARLFGDEPPSSP